LAALETERKEVQADTEREHTARQQLEQHITQLVAVSIDNRLTGGSKRCFVVGKE